MTANFEPHMSAGDGTAQPVTILVVDDSAVDRRLAGGLLQKHPGWNVTYAGDGAEALASIEKTPPDLVVTDLQMPKMDGLDLVAAIRAKRPHIPVILMTAHGSEKIAIKALQAGAAYYVPKTNLAQDLVEATDNVLSAARHGRHKERLLDCLTHSEFQFRLDNDHALVPSLIGHLEEHTTRLKLCDETGLIRLAVALHEALVNAIDHGNLELSSELRQNDGKAYYALAEERRRTNPFRDRRVQVSARLSRSKAVYTVTDEGPGFDPFALPDPTDPTNLDKVSGRGLLLIRTFMDEVAHNESGNQITMVKRREMPAESAG